jgi:putative MATE family efflux protein
MKGKERAAPEQMDLTEGVIWKTLLRYAMPVILSALLQSAYSIVDMVLAGLFVGETGISAINNSGQVLLFLTQVIMGITMGGSILMGQYYGNRDHENRVKTNVTLFSLSLLSGLFMMGLLLGLGEPILRLLKAPALEESLIYLRVCALGLLPVCGYNALAAMIRAVGNSKAPLHFIMVTTVVNIVLDTMFMGLLGWGVAGAAWATVIAQTASFLVALLYVLRHKDLFALGLGGLYIKADKLYHMLRLGVPSAVQMTMVGFSWLTMTFLVNGYGVEASAASGIAARIREVSQLFTMGMGAAAATMVAQCLGAGDFARARNTVHTGMRIAISVSLVVILVVELTAPQLVSLFHPNQETAYWAVRNLRIEILAQVFYASFMVYNALAIGAGHTLFALGSSIMNSIIARLILAALLNHYFGLVGIFWACMIAPASSVPLGYLYERSGIWKKSLAKETGGPGHTPPGGGVG